MTEELQILVADNEVIYVSIPEDRIMVKGPGFTRTFTDEFNEMVRTETGSRFFAADCSRRVWHFAFLIEERNLALMLKLKFGGDAC